MERVGLRIEERIKPVLIKNQAHGRFTPKQ
jgi:hypothetical protein